jgi:glycerol-3-phosphate cytidylyltransferase
MVRIGYAPGAYDLFHIGHLNLLRRAKEHCDYLIAGVVADEVLIHHKGVTPITPLAERVEIVRNVRFVDAAIPALTNNKIEIWKDLRFNVLFKGDDWQGTEKATKLERNFTSLGVEVVYFPYTHSTSSSTLRRTLRNLDALANQSSVLEYVALSRFAGAFDERKDRSVPSEIGWQRLWSRGDLSR